MKSVKIDFTICLLLFLFLSAFPKQSYSINKNQYYEYNNKIQQSKDWVLGEKVFKEAVNKYPEEIPFHNILNYILRSQKKYPEAFKQMDPVYNKYPDNKDVIENYKWSLHFLGWDKDKQGKKQEALKLFEKSYGLINDEQWGINSWGYILKEVGRLDESIQILQNGMKLFPENKSIKLNMISALLLRANKNRDKNLLAKANEDYQRALKIDPKDQWTILNYGIFKRVKGDFITSVQLLEEGLSRYPENKYFKPNLTHTIFQFGKNEHKKGNIDKAITIFNIGNKRFPDSIWFYYYLAEFNKEKKNYETAAKYLIKMAAKNNKKKNSKEYYHIETSIYHSIKQIFYHMTNNKKTARIFQILNILQKYMDKKYFILQLKGIQTYHSGEESKGIDLVYQAYDFLIKKHPQYKDPLVVEFPLRGTYAISGNSRRNAITHAGLDRFSFDFTGITKDGATRKNNKNGFGENADYLGFGNPVFATVDGVVEIVIDKYADLKPSNHYSLVNGNYISIKDNNGFHHLFAHLKHKSAKVVKGQKVKSGEIIGQIGNTGMTTIPHLHYGVYSKDWVVTLPLKFRNYKLLKEDLTKKGKKLNETMINAIPSHNNIVESE